MTVHEPGVLQVRSPGDLLAAVPYLLGFHPSDSLVAVAFTGTRVAVVARVDLPLPGTPRADVEAGVAALAQVLAEQAPTAALLLGYGPPEQVTPAIDLAEAAFTARVVPISDALRVTGGRYFSYHCADPGCCPPEGTPFDPTSSVLAAHATFAGHVALPDRAALVASLAPITGAAREAMREATRRARDRLGQLVRAASADLSGATPDAHASREVPSSDTGPGQPGHVAVVVRRVGADAVRDAFDRHDCGERLTDDDVARLTLLLEDVAVRDLAWAHTSGDPHRRHQQLWTDVTRRAEPEQVPAPACLLAFAAYRAGNGALARVALDRALDADPTYRLALLLSEALRQGIPASVFDDPEPDAPDAAPPPREGQ